MRCNVHVVRGDRVDVYFAEDDDAGLGVGLLLMDAGMRRYRSRAAMLKRLASRAVEYVGRRPLQQYGQVYELGLCSATPLPDAQDIRHRYRVMADGRLLVDLVALGETHDITTVEGFRRAYHRARERGSVSPNKAD